MANILVFLLLTRSSGLGTEINCEKALRYYNEAAHRGHGEAMCTAGYHELHGNSSRRNGPHAVRLLKKARKAGVIRASYHLAYCYEHGIVVDRDPNMALLLVQEAHKKGLDLAPYRLAMAYQRGLGVESDPLMAASFYREMAEVREIGTLHQSYVSFRKNLADLNLLT